MTIEKLKDVLKELPDDYEVKMNVNKSICNYDGRIIPLEYQEDINAMYVDDSLKIVKMCN